MEYGKSELIRLGRNIMREGWSDKKWKDTVDSLWRDPVLLRWSGFDTAGGPEAAIDWSSSTKILGIEPVVVNFGYYQYRNKLTHHIVSERMEADISGVIDEGFFVFYFGYDTVTKQQKLKYLYNPTAQQLAEIYLVNTYVASLYWDAATNEALYFGDDRHGSEWQPQMQRYLHLAFGARRKAGLQFADYVLNGDGSSNTHAQFSITAGTMLHDDIELAIPGISNTLPVLYCFGGLPRFLLNTGYAIAEGGRVYFNNAMNNIAQADSGNFVLYHIFATNEIAVTQRKTISVMGTAQYTDLADAYKGVEPELDGIYTYMPMQGRCYLGTVIVQTSDDYTNAVHARIVAITGNTQHPPVSIDDNTKELLEIDEKQKLAIPGNFETDEFYAIKNRIWQKITGGGGGIPDAPADGNKYARRDNTWVTVVDGDDGREVEISTSGGFIVWRYVGETAWNNICPVPQDGDDGNTPYIFGNYWYVNGVNTGFKAVGEDGVGVSQVTLESTVGRTKTYRMSFTDSSYYDFVVTDGADGDDGLGISSITLISTVGLVKTYRITYTDSTTFDFEVTDGADGTGGSEPTVLKVNSGALYNPYVLSDVRNIANTGWRVATEQDWNDMILATGEQFGDGMRLCSKKPADWDGGAVGSNETGLTLKITNERSGETGAFIYTSTSNTWGNEPALPNVSFMMSISPDSIGYAPSTNLDKSGRAIRLVKDTSDLNQGETGIYVGNDGKTYKTINITGLGVEWMAEPLCETKFRNGDWVHGFDGGVYTPILNIDWVNLTSEAMCFMDDDEAIGYEFITISEKTIELETRIETLEACCEEVQNNATVQVPSLVIFSSGWVLSGDLYEYDLYDSHITDTSIVDVIPDNTNNADVVAAGLLPQTDSYTGYVKLYAVSVPTVDLSVSINIFKATLIISGGGGD
jgi:uncharacterized protein (TIGR02145 family)